jgi:putative membrane protein
MSRYARGLGAAAAAMLASAGVAHGVADAGPSDAEIAHIAYTAGAIDVAAGEQALAKSKNATVRSFAEAMIRDHQAVNVQALALVKKLNVAPAANGTSTALSSQAEAAMKRLGSLDGAAFDRAYLDNEVAFHRTVNGALETQLIPSADNAELKALLGTGLTLFREHQAHAEHVAASLK